MGVGYGQNFSCSFPPLDDLPEATTSVFLFMRLALIWNVQFDTASSARIGKHDIARVARFLALLPTHPCSCGYPHHSAHVLLGVLAVLAIGVNVAFGAMLKW